ncbi:hypothetical protein [Bermanella sp. R86510]|uniref:hypothetical protein n=1 Tax=unclassified Bermanella TaxID=2627862 RepID=UPI0037C77E70
MLIRISWDPRQWFKKKVIKPPGIVSICLMETGVAIAYGTTDSPEQKVTIKKADFAPLAPAEQFGFIRGWLERNKLMHATCHLVLAHHDYELELVETPPVADNELAEAVRWRCKDVLSTPISDAVLEIIPLPKDAYRGRMDMLYVTAIDRTRLKNKIQFIRNIGLDLQVIDIYEMALRNLALYLPEMMSGTVALLELKENNGTLYMYSHNNLYLTRNIELGFSSFVHTEQAFQLDDDVMLDRLALDLQRSLDYYESQLGKGITSKLYILPFESEVIDLSEELQNRLSVKIQLYDAKKTLPLSSLTTWPPHYSAYILPALGGVLRRVEDATG